MQTLKAGGIYFLLVFAAGWVLGPIRELWLMPHLGRTMGSLLEAPLMVIAMILAAGWVLRCLNVPYAVNARLAVGLVALGILFVAEIAGVRWVRGISIREYLAVYETPSGLISLLLFLLFAAMPSLVERSNTHGPTGGCDALIGLGRGGDNAIGPHVPP
jgi:hypothetical protein